jgi:hypothetical protein
MKGSVSSNPNLILQGGVRCGQLSFKLFKPGNAPEQGGLTRPVLTYDTVHLSGNEREVYALQYVFGPEVLVQCRDLDHPR